MYPPPLLRAQTDKRKMKTQLIFIKVSVLEPVSCLLRKRGPPLFFIFSFNLDRLLQKHFIKPAAVLRALLHPSGGGGTRMLPIRL